jgi:hypothetical protein
MPAARRLNSSVAVNISNLLIDYLNVLRMFMPRGGGAAVVTETDRRL